jgi:excinuclease ABC subunit C
MRVDRACEFLEGKSREWLGSLRAEMGAAAGRREFEKAAALRDVVYALEKTVQKTRHFDRTDHTAVVASAPALLSLKEALALPTLPVTIECFDISHISGTYVVASMVRFADGRPDRDNYRRFRIKGFSGNDDFRAMEEVVGRRYRRLRLEGRPFPDLVVIDGGRGQVGAALKAFFALDLEPPPIIGLAKREETIVFPDGRAPLDIPIDHPGLRLLQRLRDEAHRFANTYNADLRSKKIRESLLDDFPGIGPVRRRALMERFGGIGRLLGATAGEISDVAGFGPRLGTALHAFLAKDAPAPPASSP